MLATESTAYHVTDVIPAIGHRLIWMWEGLISDGEWVARVHPLANHSPQTPVGDYRIDIPKQKRARGLLDDCQRFVTEVLRGESVATDTVIDQYRFESALRPARYLLAEGDPDGSMVDRYIDDQRVWLEGQVPGYAFRMKRAYYDLFVAPDDQLHLTLWHSDSYIVVVRRDLAMAAIPAEATFWYDNGPERVQLGVPQRVRSRLLDIAAKQG